MDILCAILIVQLKLYFKSSVFENFFKIFLEGLQ